MDCKYRVGLISPRCVYIGGFFLYLICQFVSDIYDIKKNNKKYSLNIWLIKITSFIFDLSNQI